MTTESPRGRGPAPSNRRPRPVSGPAGARLLRIAARAALAKKAEDVLALDLRDLGAVCDYFLLCSAASEIQVRAVAEHVEEKLREAGARPWHVEGLEGRRWVLLDYVEIVVHVFHEKTREYYMLDRLWGDARSVDLGLEGTD